MEKNMQELTKLKKGRKVIASIQARMGSSRLPGKVLKNVLDKPLLQVLIERAKKSILLDKIVVATSTEPQDDLIESLCRSLGTDFFRGSEDDVLERVYLAHHHMSTDIVVSLYGDCPLIDPKIIDTVIVAYLANEPCDYVTNLDPKTYPAGMELEVYPFKTLERAHNETTDPEDREHSSRYFRIRPDEFKHIYVGAPPSLSYPQLQVLLDENRDYELIKNIYEGLYPKNPEFGCRDIIDFINSNRDLLELNRGVIRRKLKK